jgi:hypothetical protein
MTQKPTLVIIALGLAILLLVSGCTQQATNPTNSKAANTSGNAITFADLVAAKNAKAFSITYSYSNTYQSLTVPGTMVQYFKYPKMRTDLLIPAFRGISVNSRVYYMNGIPTNNCAKIGANWTCSSQSLLDLPSTASVEIYPNNYNITSDGEMTVAGMATTCYKIVKKIVANQDSYSGRYCYTRDGKPLYVESETYNGIDNRVIELTATSVSENITDADFESPATTNAAG